MDKKLLSSRVVAILKNKGYKVFKIDSSIFDIYAKKGNKSYIFKVLLDAVSLTKVLASDIIKVSYILNASPYIVSEKYKGKNIDLVVYHRYDIPVISLKYLEVFFEEDYEIRTYSRVLYPAIDPEKVKKILLEEDKSLSALANEIGISKSTLVKYIKITKRMPMDVVLYLREKYGVDICAKGLLKYRIPNEKPNDNISKKLLELGACSVILHKFVPKILGKLEERKFGIITEDKELQNAIKISKAIELKMIALDIDYEDRNVISLKRKEFFELSKEDLRCLLN